MQFAPQQGLYRGDARDSFPSSSAGTCILAGDDVTRVFRVGVAVVEAAGSAIGRPPQPIGRVDILWALAAVI